MREFGEISELDIPNWNIKLIEVNPQTGREI
jgi:hypothetical protein